jgi:putative ABC transport system substrate-binding protein
LAQSLARPGGNLTGVTELATELSAKRLEILKEAVPHLKTVAMLFNAADLGMTMRSRAAEAAAKILDVSVQTLGVREPSDFGNAFAEMTRSRPDAILMVSDTLTVLNRKQVMEFASNNRLPAIYEFGFFSARWWLDVIRAELARDRRKSRRPRGSHPSRRTASGLTPRTAHSLRVCC